MLKVGKIGPLVKEAWLIVGITILLLCFLEGTFSFVFFIKDRFSASDLSADDLTIPDIYSDDPSWVNNYEEEARRSYVAQWRPYVYWRRKPYQGKYINIDTDGIRLTVSPKPTPQESHPPVKIFMFGGSTMWGVGARDAFTIPSILAQELQNKGMATEVINFGENGYVSTQEVIMLQLLLQKGQRPDLVIFYDGVNDTFSAFQQGMAGLTENEFHRVKEFNLLQPDRLIAMLLKEIASRTSTMRFLTSGLRKAGMSRETVGGNSLPFANRAPIGEEALAQEVLNTYKGNIEFVKALSEHYHFKYIFYWQPTIFQQVYLTEYERAHRPKRPALGQLVHRIYELVQKDEIESCEYSFRDLSRAFGEVTEPIFIDWSHVGESGNAIIARKMAKDVLGLIIPNK